MDRNDTYKYLSTLQDDNNNLLFGSETINKLKQLSDENLQYYLSYLNNLLYKKELGDSFKQYRSKQLDFLKYISKNNCELLNVSQNIIDDYFEIFANELPSTKNTRVQYLKPLFLFHDINHIDLDKHLSEKTDKENNKNKDIMPRISAEKFSEAKFFYVSIRNNNNINSEEYIDATKKLFVLKMLFYTPLSQSKIGVFFKTKHQFDENNIYFDGEKYSVPQSLILLLKEMQAQESNYLTLDIKTHITKMRIDLAEFNMENLNSKDADKTTETIFWSCPQCGEKFLAIAENWCIKQYTEDGDNWVVCKENCGYE